MTFKSLLILAFKKAKVLQRIIGGRKKEIAIFAARTPEKVELEWVLYDWDSYAEAKENIYILLFLVEDSSESFQISLQNDVLVQ